MLVSKEGFERSLSILCFESFEDPSDSFCLLFLDDWSVTILFETRYDDLQFAIECRPAFDQCVLVSRRTSVLSVEHFLDIFV